MFVKIDQKLQKHCKLKKNFNFFFLLKFLIKKKLRNKKVSRQDLMSLQIEEQESTLKSDRSSTLNSDLNRDEPGIFLIFDLISNILIIYSN